MTNKDIAFIELNVMMKLSSQRWIIALMRIAWIVTEIIMTCDRLKRYKLIIMILEIISIRNERFYVFLDRLLNTF